MPRLAPNRRHAISAAAEQDDQSAEQRARQAVEELRYNRAVAELRERHSEHPRPGAFQFSEERTTPRSILALPAAIAQEIRSANSTPRIVSGSSTPSHFETPANDPALLLGRVAAAEDLFDLLPAVPESSDYLQPQPNESRAEHLQRLNETRANLRRRHQRRRTRLTADSGPQFDQWRRVPSASEEMSQEERRRADGFEAIQDQLRPTSSRPSAFTDAPSIGEDLPLSSGVRPSSWHGRDRVHQRHGPAGSPESFDGLGDRDRSFSPDSPWDTLSTTIAPDPQPPSIGSSFVSNSTTANSGRSTIISASTTATSVDGANVSPFNCDNSESEGSNTDADEDDSLPQLRARNAISYAAVVASRRLGAQRHRARADANGDHNLWQFETGAFRRHAESLTDLQRIVGRLAARGDIPDSWWAGAGLSRIISDSQ